MRSSNYRKGINNKNRGIKTLSVAALIGLAFIGTCPVQAANTEKENINTSNRKLELILPLNSNSGTITGAATPVMDSFTGASANNYISSLISFNEITPQDPDNLAPNVIRYYNPNIDNNVHYYELNFKNSVIGSGENSKYYKWAKIDNTCKLVQTTNSSESVLTLKYDDSTFIDNIVNQANTEIDYISNNYLNQSVKNAISNIGTINSITSRFIGNNIDITDTDGVDYVAIQQKVEGSIGTVNSSFIGNNISINMNNSGTIYGTLIKSLGSLDEITSEFVSNTVTSDTMLEGGLLYTSEKGAFGKLQSDFISNSISTNSRLDGAVIANIGTIGSIDSSLFIGNTAISTAGTIYGGVLYTPGKITNGINNSVFSDNKIKSISGNSYGGAIYNTKALEITNTSFINNIAESVQGTAMGGAIYTDSTLTIKADNGVSELSGNYIINSGIQESNAIYFDTKIYPLTFNAINNGTILLNDAVNGDAGYITNMTGDGSGLIQLNNHIYNTDLVTGNINISYINGRAENAEYISLSSSDATKWRIDIDYNNNKADTITAGVGSHGKVWIDEINLLNGAPEQTSLIKILTGDKSLQLGLTDRVIADNTKETKTQTGSQKETITPTADWSKVFSEQIINDVVDETIELDSSDGDGIYDSIKYSVVRTVQYESDTSQGDTLRLLNEYIDGGTRNFNASRANEIYTVTEDAGITTSGQLNITGKYDSSTKNRSTINAGEHTLFNLSEDSTGLQVKGVNFNIESNQEGSLINIANGTSNAKIIATAGTMTINAPNAANAIINNGTLEFNAQNGSTISSNTGVTGSGATTLGGNIKFTDGASINQASIGINSGANVSMGVTGAITGAITNKGTLNIDVDNLFGNVNNTNRLNLQSGTLNYDITGSGNTYLYGNLNVADDVLLNQKNIYFSQNGTKLTIDADYLRGSVDRVDATVDYSTLSLDLKTGTLNSTLKSTLGDFTVNILGDVVYNAVVGTKTVIGEGNTLTTSGNYRSGLIENNGTLIFTGGTDSMPYGYGSGSITITGTGNIIIKDGTFITNNKYIQDTIHIQDNATWQFSSVTNSAFELSELIIDGTLKLTGYNVNITPDTVTRLSGHGKILIDSSNNYPYYIHGHDIVQDLEIASGSLEIFAENLKGNVLNNGNLYLSYSDSTLSTDIFGDGSVYIYAGNIQNNANIYNKIVMNQDNNRTLISDADLLKNTISMSSVKNKLLLTGGVLDHAVTGSGTIEIAENTNVISNASIAGKLAIKSEGSLTIDGNNLSSIAVLENNSNLNLTGSGTITKDITGETGTVNILGDIIYNNSNPEGGITSKVEIKDGGKLTTDAGLLKNPNINNLAKLYLSGTLDKEIFGTGTTYINNALELNTGAKIDGSFNLNNGTLSFAQENYDSYNLGTATGSGDLILNIDVPENKVATLNMSNLSDAIFYVTEANLKLADETSIGASGIVQILLDNSTSTLALKDGPIEFRDTHFEEFLDGVNADVYYDDEFNLHTNLADFIGTIELATKDKTYDSIKWTVNSKEFLDDVVTEVDMFSEWVKYKPEDENEKKYFRFRTANDIYEIKVPEDEKHQITEVGTAAKGELNIIGVSDEESKSVIDLKGLPGITIKSGTVFNASDVEFKNGSNRVMYLSGGIMGSIDANNEISGGLTNVSLTNYTLNELNNNAIYLDNNSKIYQITDSDFSNNSFNYSNDDSTVKITTYNGVLRVNSGASIGTKYTDSNGETIWAGGIINTKFSNNTSNVDSLNAYIFGPSILLIGGTISNIVDSEFSNNVINANQKAQMTGGTAIYMHSSNSYIDNIENTKFIGNKILLEQGVTESDRSGGVIYARNASSIGTIKDSLFQDNVGIAGAALSCYNTGVLNVSLIENTIFDSNSTTRGGGAISMVTIGTIKDSKFTNNIANAGGAIDSSNINLIENTLFEANHAYHSGAIYSGTIGEIKNSRFINNSTKVGQSDRRGGALNNVNINKISDSYFSGNSAVSGGAISAHEKDGVQSIINTTFEENSVENYGGALYFAAHSIKDSTFTGNTAMYGGAIYADSKLDEITSSIFTNNVAQFSTGSGGAIYIDKNVTELNISGTIFTGNNACSNTYDSYGGAIHLASAGNGVINIINSTFSDNYVNSYRVGEGGAIANSSNMTVNIIADNDTSNFRNNYVLSQNNRSLYGGAITNTASGVINILAKNNGIINFIENRTTTSAVSYGGVIYSNGDIFINAESGGAVTFQNNYTNRNGTVNYNAIYINSPSATLTLNASGGGNIYMYDNIDGTIASNQAYKTQISGDGTGTVHLFNQIYNSDIDVSGNVTINMVDNNLTTYTIRSLTSADTAKYNIDINFDTEESDVFNLTSDSSGIIYINDLNIIGEGAGKKTVQIIKSNNDNIQLRLNSDIMNVVPGTVETLGDTVYNDVEYKDGIGYALATTNTHYDSITKVMTEQIYNAMQLIASSKNNLDRTFEFRTSDTYYLTEDVGEISIGSLTIKGLSSGSTVNANGYEMFNLTNSTDLNIYDTKLTNAAGNIITVNNENANVTLKNAYIEGNIAGSNKFQLNISGTGKTTLNGTVTNADTMFNSGELVINPNTFSAGNDKLTINGGQMTLANGEIEAYNINNLASSADAEYTIDYNPITNAIDTIRTSSSEATGTIKISNINFINNIEDQINRTVRILYNAPENHKLQLKLADNVASDFKLKNIDRIESEQVLKINTFDTKYYDRLRKGDLYCKIELATSSDGTTFDSLKFTSSEVWEETTVPIRLHGDTLALVNQADINDRRFTSNSAGEVYTVTENLGQTGSGDFTILGLNGSSGTISQKSTINLAGYSGFELGDSTLTINGIRISGAKDNNIIKSINSNAKAIIGNTFFDGDIIGSKKLNLTLSGDDTTTITGKIINADVYLTKGGLVITPETFKDSSTSLTASAEGVLTSVNMQNNKLEDYYFNNLTSTQDVNYHIDIDLSTRKSDTINLTGDSSGIIKLESLNILGKLSGITVDDEIEIPILYTNGSNTSLIISETIAAQTDTDYNLGSASEISLYSTVNPLTKWNDELTQTTDTYDIVGRLALGKTGDVYNLRLYHLKANLVSNTESLGDTLALWNATVIEGNPDKYFEYDEQSGSPDIYNLSTDLGTTTAGKLFISGKDKNSTINLNDHQGFVFENETEMSVENVTFTNANFQKGSLFNITNSNAKLNLNNVTVKDTQSINAISNNGTINMTGGEIVLNSGIIGDGVTNIKNGTDVSLGDGISIAQQTLNVENGSLTIGISGRIIADTFIGESGTVKVEASGIDGSVTNNGLLTLNSGKLNETVDGTGKIVIQDEVTSSADIIQGIIENKSTLTNNANITVNTFINDNAVLKGTGSLTLTGTSQNSGKITQINLTLNENAKLITNASDVSITNNISNAGNITLTGGDLTNVIDGIGSTTINGTVKNISAINQSVNVTDAGKFNVGADIGALTNEGNVSANANNLKGAITNSNLITLTGGTLAQIVSGEGSVTINGVVNNSANINQAVAVTSDGKFDAGADIGELTNKGIVSANASNLKGAITNSNLMTLTGGTLSQTLTGSGKTIISGDVTNTTAISQDIEVTDAGALRVEANINNIINEGTVTANANYLQAIITNNKDLILTSGTLTQAVVGTGNTTITGNVSNTAAINQDVIVSQEGILNINANVNNLTNNGTVTTTANYLTKSVTNNQNAILNLQGSLNKTIAGAGVTKIDSSLTLTNNAKIEGVLDLNNANLSVKDSLISTNIIGTMKGYGRVSIDADGNTSKADKFTVGQNSNGTLLIDNINWITTPKQTFKAQILSGNSSSMQLSLSDDITNTVYDLGTISGYTTNDTPTAQIAWDANLYNYSVSKGYLKGSIGLAKTTNDNDSIAMYTTTISGERTNNYRLDTLFEWNKLDTTSDKIFNFTSEEDIYTVADNLGSTKGTNITVNGIHTGEKYSKIEFGDNSGFETQSGQILNINNIELNGNSTVISNGGILELNNTLLDGNITGDGDIAISGESTLSGEVTAGALSNTNILNNNATLDITNSITNDGTIISAANLLNASSIINNNKLQLTQGTLATEVTGTAGSTEITGSVTNNKEINQSVKVTSEGAFIVGADIGSLTNEGTATASAENLKGNITNTGDLYLSGVLTKTVAGDSGKTYANTNLTMNEGANISGELILDGKTLILSSENITTHNIGKITTNGNIELDVDAVTNIADTINITGTGSNAILTITKLNLTKQNIADNETSKVFTKQILTGSGNTSDVTLALSADVNNQYNKEFSISDSGTDNLETNHIVWNSAYGDWSKNGTQKETLKIVNSSATLADSIEYAINKVWEAKTYDTKEDNLALINAYEGTGYENRVMDFVGIQADTEVQGIYKVSSNLGTTYEGTLILNGEKDNSGNNTIIDLNNHSGFLLTNESILELNNIDIGDLTNGKNSSNTTIATVSNSSAIINLHNVTLNGKITGSGYSLNTSGTTNINGTVGAHINNSGTLSANISNLNGIINNTGTFNMTGDLSKDISGNGITSLQSSTANVTENINITGTLDVNSKTIGMNDSSFETLTVGKLTGNGFNIKCGCVNNFWEC